MSNIYLIGFMGAGKSTIGRLISKQLILQFFDTDELIERKTGQTITKIFNERGEASFRLLEADVIREIAEQKQAVVALGGGAVMNDDSWNILEKSGIIFYLKWPDEVILNRILHSQHRPLVAETDFAERKVALQSKLDSRQKRYHRAHHIIDCYDGMLPSGTAEMIIQILEQK